MNTEVKTETLGHWAKRCGISYRTAWRWFHTYKLPEGVSGEQTPTGTILVQDTRSCLKSAIGSSTAVIYGRINPRQSHSDLEEQIRTCKALCLTRGWVISRIIREVAPGVGSRRVKLAKLIEERPPRLVIANTSILSRFDFGFYEALWEKIGCQLVVVDRSSELRGAGGALEDLTDAINITCHRHYGPKRGTALVNLLSRVIRGSVTV